ncbi:MAG: hypothetical protein OXU40_04145 [Nitrospira sp.]|nr:hypothetical protein [Nitrospira sp.]
MPIDSGSGGGGTLKPGGEAYGDNLLTTALEVTTTSQNLPIQLQAGKWYGLLFSDGTANEPGPMLSWRAPVSGLKGITFALQEFYKVNFTIGATTTAMAKTTGSRTLYLREIRLAIAQKGARGNQGIPGDALAGGPFSDNVLPRTVTINTNGRSFDLGVRLEAGQWYEFYVSKTADRHQAVHGFSVKIPSATEADHWWKAGVLGNEATGLIVDKQSSGNTTMSKYAIGVRGVASIASIDVDAIYRHQSAKGDGGVGREELYAVGPTRTLNANQSPSNDWRYGLVDAAGNAITAPQNGIRWYKTRQPTTATNKYPFIAERKVVGIPNEGDEVTADWDTPVLTSEPGRDSSVPDATETVAGKVRRATSAEVQARTEVNAFVPPNLLSSAMGQILRGGVFGENLLSSSVTLNASPAAATSFGRILEPGSWYIAFFARTEDAAIGNWEQFRAPARGSTVTLIGPLGSGTGRGYFGIRIATGSGTTGNDTGLVVGGSGENNPRPLRLTEVRQVKAAKGDGGVGREKLYAVGPTRTLNANQYPSNDWRYGLVDAAGNAIATARNGIRWYKTPQSTTPTNKYPFVAVRKTVGTPSEGDEVSADWAVALISEPGQDGSGPRPTSPLGYEPPWSFIRQSTTAGPEVSVASGSAAEVGSAWNTAAGKHGDFAVLGLTPLTSSFSFTGIPSDTDTDLHVVARMRISYQLFHGTIELLIKETYRDAQNAEQTRVTSLDTITIASNARKDTANSTMRTPNGVVLKARSGRTYTLFIKGTPETARPSANVGFWNGGVTDEDGIWLAKAKDVSVPDASETVAGRVRRATAAEVQVQAAVNAFVPPNLVSSAVGQISVGGQASDVDPIADRVIDEEDLSDILKAKVLSEYSFDVTNEVDAVVCSQYVGRGELGNDKPYSTATIGTPLNASLPSIYQRGSTATNYALYKRALEFSQNTDLTAQEGARAYGLNIEQLDELAVGDRLLLYATLYTADNSSVERVIFALQSGSNTAVALYRKNDTTIEARVGDTRIVNMGVGEIANRFFKVGMYIKRTGQSGFEFRLFGGGRISNSATATISGLISTTVTVGVNPTYVRATQESLAIASSFRGLMFDVVVMHPTQDAEAGWAGRTSDGGNDRTIPYGNAMHIRLVQGSSEYQYTPGDNLVGSTPQVLSQLNSVTSITLGATGVDLDKILGFWAEFDVNGRGYRQFLPVEFIPRRTSAPYTLDASTGLVSHYDPGIIVVSKGSPSPNNTGDHWYFTTLLVTGSAVARTLDFWPGTISEVRSASVTSLRVVAKRR